MKVKPNTLKKIGKCRLKKRRDFLRIQRGGLRFKGRFLTVMSRPKYEKALQGVFGIVAPKSIGKANVRNLVKRRLRHIVALVPEILISHDVVLLTSPNSVIASFDDLKTDVQEATRRLNMVSKHKNQR